ncbi:uncharacterized protein PAC_19493 [Phialocephala subalpina]|uniref:Uncharacterized protein n=1 Tax=Phialocephala subalpina TaxID=576137 RepID=A0A1L7XX13_9HELO|nr:uncharacterized protein PAC_19493 [Phialocephala subalpina]
MIDIASQAELSPFTNLEGTWDTFLGNAARKFPGTNVIAQNWAERRWYDYWFNTYELSSRYPWPRSLLPPMPRPKRRPLGGQQTTASAEGDSHGLPTYRTGQQESGSRSQPADALTPERAANFPGSQRRTRNGRGQRGNYPQQRNGQKHVPATTPETEMASSMTALERRQQYTRSDRTGYFKSEFSEDRAIKLEDISQHLSSSSGKKNGTKAAGDHTEARPTFLNGKSSKRKRGDPESSTSVPSKKKQR